jgi:hypothetical protein
MRCCLTHRFVRPFHLVMSFSVATYPKPLSDLTRACWRTTALLHIVVGHDIAGPIGLTTEQQRTFYLSQQTVRGM